MTKVVLASQSKARRALLAGAGVAHEAVSALLDEEAAKAELEAKELSPHDLAEALAAAKAIETSRAVQGLVIGADQTLDFHGDTIGKAASVDEARERLQALRGHHHRLHSAVAVARGGELLWADVQTATLKMRDFSDDFLEAYLARNGEAALSSVGCYQLEGEGVQLFERIDGEYFTILGLPLPPLLEFLREQGVLAR